MLNGQSLFVYVVDRDFGFAPNPFHGFCTLATCKPRIRSSARLGDWILGVGGARLKATGTFIYAMQVTGSKTFQQYWDSEDCQIKKPVRNGSKKMMLGDNIYHKKKDGCWLQEDSHHSNADGTPNVVNVTADTRTDRILLSENFVYFGCEGPDISESLAEIGYKNRINHRRFKIEDCEGFVDWIAQTVLKHKNRVLGDPFEFGNSAARYVGSGSKIV